MENTKHFAELLTEMTKRELKVRYKNTIFGFLWIIVNPLLQMLVIGFVFRFFIKEPVDNYYFYLLIGLLIWNFFSLSVTKATASIVNERSLIKKSPFPREIIPLSIILSNFINLLIAFVLLTVPLVYLGIWSLLNFPNFLLGIVLLLLFTTGFSLFACALNVRFRDINFFVQALLIVWFYASPIVYSINVVPYKFMWLWRLNPMTSIIQLFQNGLISAPSPGIAMFSANLLMIIITLFCGIKVFKSESKNFDDWI